MPSEAISDGLILPSGVGHGRAGHGRESSDREERMRRQRGVDRERPVVVRAVDRLLVHDDAAYLRPREDVAAVAGDEEVLAGPRVVRRPGLLRLDGHDGDVVPIDLAGQPGAAADRYRPARGQTDAAGEEQVGDACDALLLDAEHPGVFEEEIPFLREEQGEPGQVDLLLVHLDLREVGVRGHVEVEPRGDAVFQVEPDLAEARAGESVRRYTVLASPAQRIGRDPQVEPAVHPAQAGHRAGPAHAGQVVALRNRGPIDLLVLAPDVPHEVDAPDLTVRLREPHRHHRDRDLGDPALGGAAGRERATHRPSRD